LRGHRPAAMTATGSGVRTTASAPRSVPIAKTAIAPRRGPR
jgi:hypothetical protein